MNRLNERLGYIKKIFANQKYQIIDLPSDASSRTYHRIMLENESYILMDDNSKNNDIYQFYKIDKFLSENNIRVPKIIEEDLSNGFLLLEDLGDDIFSKLIASGESQEILYSKATDVLIDIANNIKEKPEFVPNLDEEFIRRDLSYILDYYYPSIYGKEISQNPRDEFYEIIDELMIYKDKLSDSISLCDCHIDNLMIDKKGDCVQLDFQDAMWGSIAYDILSLLEDARREVPVAIQEKCLNQFILNVKDLDQNDFTESYKFFSLFRHIRVIGIFSRLHLRDKKSSYLKFIPHCFNMLNHRLQDEKFYKMKSWFERYMPEENKADIKVA